ncbi:MAG: GTP-binding protein [Stellaceae bacterium]
MLWLKESDRRYICHLVGQRFTLDESDAQAPEANRLVLIGRQLDHQMLREQLARCLVSLN